MTFETWLAFLLAASANVVSPGPAIALAIRNGLVLGAGPTLYSTFGNVTAIALVGLAVSFGLGLLVTGNPELLAGLRLLGGSYLLYLAMRAWKSGLVRLDVSTGNASRARGIGLFVQSMMIGLTNPKMLVFLMALFPLFLDPDQPMESQLLTMTGTFMTLSFLSLSTFALVAGRCARLIRKPEILRRVNQAIACIFAGFGASLVLAGGSGLLNQLEQAAV